MVERLKNPYFQPCQGDNSGYFDRPGRDCSACDAFSYQRHRLEMSLWIFDSKRASKLKCRLIDFDVESVESLWYNVIAIVGFA